MMKYLATALILTAMAWTWRLSTTGGDHSFTLEDHKAVEAQVQEIITRYVKDKRPAATEVVFQQLFTETIKAGAEMRANFRYRIAEPFKDGEATAEVFEGTVRLGSTDGGQNWSWLGEAVKAPAIEFQKGMQVLGPKTDRPDSK